MKQTRGGNKEMFVTDILVSGRDGRKGRSRRTKGLNVLFNMFTS
jgi:hypothetical protein